MEPTIQDQLRAISDMLRFFEKYQDANLLINLSVLLQKQGMKYHDDLKKALEEPSK